MSSYIVLTAMGPDRPGLVDDISKILAERNVNIEDSRMAVLGGEFAIILLASGDKGIAENLTKELFEIEKRTGLSIQIKTTINPGMRKIRPSIPHRLLVTSMDHPGIVHEITRLLHDHLINIESLDTHVSHAPVSGAPIFNMKCTINIPADEKLSAIKKELEELSDSLNVDIEFEGIESF